MGRGMAENKAAAAASASAEGTRLKWDDSNMKSSYANVYARGWSGWRRNKKR